MAESYVVNMVGYKRGESDGPDRPIGSIVNLTSHLWFRLALLRPPTPDDSVGSLGSFHIKNSGISR
jgi:hypothetical protein